MTTRNSLVATIAAALMAVLLPLAVQPAQAATIVWSAPQNIVGDSDVFTNDSLFASANFASSTVTVNGVTFDAFPITAGGTSASNGNIAVSTLTGTGFSVSSISSFSNPYNALTTAYKTLLSPALTNQGAGNQLLFTLSNLTVGSTYTIQYWANDSRNNGIGRTTIVGTQTLDANVTDANGGLGQYVRGTFVADTTSQSFTASAGPTAPPGSGSFTYANALQVRVVPEPSTMFLAAVGLVCADVVRRSRRRTARAC